MSLLETALTLLRRPVENAGEPQGRRKAPGPTDPLTEAELTDTLTRLSVERQEAETTLAGAAERREALLMEPSSDDEIFALAQSIDRANLALERLDRLQPDLEQKLGEVKYYNRGAKWTADRDIAAAGFEQFVAVVEAYENARAQWSAVWNGLVNKWPTANEIMPWMPALDGSSGAYRNNLDAFRNRVIVLKAPPQPLYHTLANAIEYARKTGLPPDGIPGEWVTECERAVAGAATVRMLVSSLDADGRPLDKGHVVTMPYDEATKAVRSGRAIYCDG